MVPHCTVQSSLPRGLWAQETRLLSDLLSHFSPPSFPSLEPHWPSCCFSDLSVVPLPGASAPDGPSAKHMLPPHIPLDDSFVSFKSWFKSHPEDASPEHLVLQLAPPPLLYFFVPQHSLSFDKLCKCLMLTVCLTPKENKLKKGTHPCLFTDTF